MKDRLLMNPRSKLKARTTACLALSLILATAASSAYAQDYRLVGIQQLVPSPAGGRAAWSPGPNNLIAYDSLNATTGFYDVWTMNPDGSNQTCLTCNWQPPPANGATSNPQPYYNKGNPDWDPTGQYIVFEVQRNDTTYSASGNTNSRPGIGEDDVLYIMDAAGQNFWPVPASMNFTPHNGGVLQPKYSHNTSSRGQMLFWAQMTANGTNNYNGVWEIQVASVTIVNGAPTVTVLYTVSPDGPSQCFGPFYETHGFSLDDSTIFFSGNPEFDCANALGYDEYSYNLNTQAVANLNNTPAVWDEQARPNPVQEKLMYISSYGLNPPSGVIYQEYWTMNYDGSDKKKITWVTDPSGQYFNATIPNFYVPSATSVGRCDWSHDGLQAVIYFGDTAPSGQSAFGQPGSIWELTLEYSSTTANSASYLNFPQAANSIAMSWGTNLATQQAAATTTLGTNLGGTTVFVQDSTGATRQANLFFVDAEQVNWQIPPGTAAGPAIVTTTSGNGTATTDIFEVAPVAPGIYGIDATGSGPAAAYILPGGQYTFTCASAYNCTNTPIDVSSGGTYLILFGTGIEGYTNPVVANFTDQSGNALASSTVSYAGAQGQYTGLDQVNVQLPASLAGAGLVNVNLTVDAQTSNTLQVQIQ
jgi:uncharacterized protein (TIGR03437 family)